MVLWGQDVAADAAVGSPSVKIEKTFDQGTLIEHTLTMVHPPHTVSLHVSQRRTAEGSETIAHTYLAFRHEAPEDAALMTRVEFETAFAQLMTAFQDAFGAGQVPDSLGSGGFLGVGEMEKNSALAFRDFASWEAYLDNPAAFTQWQIHAVVLERWKAAKVFEPVIAALARAGYVAELSGFEKLFVFKASELKTGPELQALGIPGRQKYPYPGMIAFTIKARR
jgi:hypothetical protein